MSRQFFTEQFLSPILFRHSVCLEGRLEGTVQFATRLRQERLRRHLSQEALAEVLGVSPRSIIRWEQGKVIPQASVRLQLMMAGS